MSVDNVDKKPYNAVGDIILLRCSEIDVDRRGFDDYKQRRQTAGWRQYFIYRRRNLRLVMACQWGTKLGQRGWANGGIRCSVYVEIPSAQRQSKIMSGTMLELWRFCRQLTVCRRAKNPGLLSLRRGLPTLRRRCASANWRRLRRRVTEMFAG